MTATVVQDAIHQLYVASGFEGCVTVKFPNDISVEVNISNDRFDCGIMTIINGRKLINTLALSELDRIDRKRTLGIIAVVNNYIKTL